MWMLENRLASLNVGDGTDHLMYAWKKICCLLKDGSISKSFSKKKKKKVCRRLQTLNLLHKQTLLTVLSKGL